MKVEVDVPDDLRQVVKDIAQDFSCSMGEAVVWLMRRGVGEKLERPLLRINESPASLRSTRGASSLSPKWSAS
jgi:hypothetical protein